MKETTRKYQIDAQRIMITAHAQPCALGASPQLILILSRSPSMELSVDRRRCSRLVEGCCAV
eukprot:scaffold12667_cov50-Phaeocystis_antarctica.AAC.8